MHPKDKNHPQPKESSKEQSIIQRQKSRPKDKNHPQPKESSNE
jgi:hypothetical protein